MMDSPDELLDDICYVPCLAWLGDDAKLLRVLLVGQQQKRKFSHKTA